MLKVGENALDFSLPDQNGEIHKLHDYKGKCIFLYFYPKDDTPGCTEEACDLRDSIARITSLGIEVIGISPDSVKSHKKFADKHTLGFTILADVEKKVVEEYDVWKEKKFMGKTYMGVIRTSFIINPEGKIAKVY